MCTSPVQYGTYTTLQPAKGFSGLSLSQMPVPVPVSSSSGNSDVRLNVSLSGAQVSALKHAPPPSMKNSTFVGSPWRTWNVNVEPSLHMQSAGATIVSHASTPEAGSVVAGSVMAGASVATGAVLATVTVVSGASASLASLHAAIVSAPTAVSARRKVFFMAGDASPRAAVRRHGPVGS